MTNSKDSKDIKKLYRVARSRERRFVAEEEDGLVAWPDEKNGWSSRVPFEGTRRQLVEVDAAEARGTGWPGGAGGGRRRLGGAEHGVGKLIRAAPALWAQADAKAKAGDLSLNEFVRRAIQAACG